MNEVAIIPQKPLTVIERASLVFVAIKSEDELRALAKSSETIVTITNEAGKDQCHAARMVLKNTRLEIERTGEEGREDAVQTSKAIIARQKALIKITAPEEDRLAAIQKTWDDRVAAEKEAKILAEIARQDEIQRRIDGMRNWPVNAANQPSMLVGQMLAQAQAYLIDAEVFGEHVETALAVLAASTAALSGLLLQRKAFEAEQLQAEEDRKELARLKSEEVERQRAAAEERAKQEADAKVKRDAETARQQAILDEQRQALERDQADARARQQAEDDRLAKDRAEIAAQQEALRKAAEPIVVFENKVTGETLSVAAEPKPEPVKPAPARTATRIIERPTAAQLIALVSGHYSVSLEMAAKWIRHTKIELEEAAA